MAGRALKPEPFVRAALRRLRGRDDVRLVERLARTEKIPVRVVGGAVRDVFLKRKGGDLDLVLPRAEAARFAERLAKSLGTRVVAVGVAPKRILKIPRSAHEIDVWETEEEPEEDLLRRDLTINALAFDLPAGTFAAPEGALEDLRSHRLAPPRPGVFLEDPLRVVRAARFVAELPGFRISTTAVPELRQAAPFLRKVAPERILAEMDRLLSTPPKRAAHALMKLETWGALPVLLPGATARQRRRGISLVGRLKRPSPPVARVLLLLPLGETKGLFLLRGWKIPTRDLRLASTLFSLSMRRPPGARNPAEQAGHHIHFRRKIVLFLRSVSPFFKEAVLFLRPVGDAGAQRLLDAVEPLVRRKASLSRILRPSRPLNAAEVSRLLVLPEGPALGAALRELDVALAAGEVRGKRAAIRHLLTVAPAETAPSR